MKYSKQAAIVLALLTLSSSAIADTLFPIQLKKLTDEPNLATVNLTANPSYSATISEVGYAGTSTIAPCSDLQLVAKAGPDQVTIATQSRALTSSELVGLFGQAATCVKVDITVSESGHVYSTGNLLTHWDSASSTYDSVLPNVINIDMSNQ